MSKWGKSRPKDKFIDDGSDDQDEKRPAKKAARTEEDADGITVCEVCRDLLTS
jgi:hypothetical protein